MHNVQRGVLRQQCQCGRQNTALLDIIVWLTQGRASI